MASISSRASALAHIATPGLQQRALALREEFGELANVCGVRRNGEWRQSFLDLQVIEKAGKHTGIGFGRHGR